MKNKLVEITDLKQITTSSKSCKFDEECILKSKYSKLTLSLDNKATKTLIYLKRISGNGHILINNNLVVVNSKISHCYELPQSIESIDMERPSDGTGEISIYGISCLYETNEGDDTLAQNWKSLISKCGSYELIRLVGNRLFATQGAFLANSSIIKEIETSPSGMFQNTDGKIVFLGSCEIIKLVIDESAPSIPKSAHNVYAHREAAMPLVLPQELLNSSLSQLPKFDIRPVGIQKQIIPNPILYDSIAVREFDKAKIPNNSPIKFIRSNGSDYLHLKKGGTYSISMSFIRPNVEYIVIISSKRLNGNGKLQVGFVHSGRTIHYGVNMVSENSILDTYLNINSSNPPSIGENYKLMISMAENSIGEVLVSRIQIIEGISLETYRSYKINPRPVASTPIQIASISVTGNDPVALYSKAFSILPIDSYQPITSFNLSATIQTTSFNAAQWLSKIRPMFPQLKINSGSINLMNLQRTTDPPDVVIGSLGSLIPNKRIWIEEFQGEVPSAKDMEAIQLSNVIMSPSLPNVQYLRNKFPGKRIIQIPKYWPHIDSVELSSTPYVLYFEKNPILTNVLLQSWSDEFPPLVVIGTCQVLLPNSVTISPYLPYKDIYKLLGGAHGLIDLGYNTHYMSGILDLSHSLGIKITTNNQWLRFAKPKPEYVESKTFFSGVMIPDINELRSAIKNMLSKSHNRVIIENYNFNLESALQTMVSAE